jgi:hypothetical protein
MNSYMFVTELPTGVVYGARNRQIWWGRNCIPNVLLPIFGLNRQPGFYRKKLFPGNAFSDEQLPFQENLIVQQVKLVES